ncbi:MAG: hypothetical protein AMXMBFR37_26970 [Steroidobacteraceae bacterium]
MSNRYLRHNLIDWFDQALLKQLDVLIIGAGAVGNEIIKTLVLLGVGRLRIVDLDRIELHNLTRSPLFTEADIGAYKAEIAATAALRLDPSCSIESVVGDFWRELSFADLQRSSVVFCCVDNFEARFRLNQLCSLLGVDLINAGIDSRFASVEIFPFARDPDCGCYECNIPPSTYQRMAERYSCGWLKKVAFEAQKVPTTAVTAGFAGALAAAMFLYSFREDHEDGARRVFMDTITSIITKSALPRRETCPNCSNQFANRIVLRASRNLAESGVWRDLSTDITLQLSDPILASWRAPNCPDCAAFPATEVFELADKFDDSLTYCDKCRMNQRLVDIRDQFTLKELRERFAGRPLPGKFVSFNTDGVQVIFELYDGGT